MKYICSKCGREFARKNNLDMHEKFCDGTKKESKKKKITDKLPINKKIINTDKVECKNSKTGLHDLVVLKPINAIQYKAIENGYTAYCQICKELI